MVTRTSLAQGSFTRGRLVRRVPVPLLLLGFAAFLGLRADVLAAPILQDPPPGYQWLPEVDDPQSPDHDDGRFLILTGPGNFSLPEPSRIQLAFDGASTRVQVYAFDPNTDGLWDQRANDPGRVLVKPTVRYRLYADPDWWDATNNVATRLRNGEVIAPVAEVLSTDPVVDASDDAWVQLFDFAPDAGALSIRSGEYAYLFEARLTPNPVNGGLEACGYKLAFNGRYRLGKDTLLGFVGGAVDAHADPVDANGDYVDSTRDPENPFAGTFRFSFDTSALCSPLELTDIDADWNAAIGASPDLAPTGVPPDDGGRYLNPSDQAIHNSSAFGIGPAIQWIVQDPNGVTRFTSQGNSPQGHPSVSAEFAEGTKTTTLDLATLRSAPGRWTWIWQGVDHRNFVFIRANAPLGTISPPPSAGGSVYCDDDEDLQRDLGEQGLAGVTVTLQPAGGGAPTHATTDATGGWRVQVPNGTYSVTTDVTAFTSLKTLPLTLVVDRCDPKDTDLPYRCRGQVCGKVFCDADGDGAYASPPDTPIAVGQDVTVRLERIVNGAVVETVVVPTTGGLDYCANDLVLGEWRVAVVEPNGVTDTLQPTIPQPRTATISHAAPLRTDVHFGYLCTARIDGRVFCDFDGNGVFDGVDEPIPGVVVGFTPTNPLQPAFTATTDAQGLYGSDVMPGEWTITIDPNQAPLQGATPQSPLSVTTTVAPKETKDVLFRFQCSSSLEGIVFRQPLGDCDTAYEPPTDQGIGGVVVRLEQLDAQGFPIAGTERQTTADGAGPTLGRYRFLDLVPGAYRVSVDGTQAAVVNLRAATPLVLTPAVPKSTAVKDQDFGFCPRPGISGTVWRNADGVACDDVQQPAELGIAGVTVSLWKQSAPPPAPAFRTTTTNAAGFYEFPDLEEGPYVLRVTGGVPDDVYLVTQETLSPVLLPDANVTDQDFGYCPLSRIRVTVYRGQDGVPCDGIRQPGEVGIAGVQVTLTGLDPAVPVKTLTTDAAGQVLFDDLKAGTYRVDVPGGQPVLVNLTPSTPTTADVTLPPGTTKDVLVGYCPPGSIRGVVFREGDGVPCDGVRHASEVGIAGVEVELVGLDPVRPPVTTTTNALGEYEFPDLPEGTYRVTVDGTQAVLLHLTPSTSLEADRAVLPGQTQTADFGFCPPAVLRGVVFREADGVPCDGVRHPSEAGIPGVVVELTGTNPVLPPVTTTTNALGQYEFPNLAPGSYQVRVDGGQPVLVNLSPSTDLTVARTVLPGETKEVDFGFCGLGLIQGVVWREADGVPCDGVRHASEAGIAGVTVRLVGVAPPRAAVTTVTNADGEFAFPDLPAGSYTVHVDGAQPVLLDLSPSTPLDVDVALPTGGTRTVDFGFCPPAEVRGIVWRESDGEPCDGVREPSAGGIAGVEVVLEGLSPVVAPATRVTDANGAYAFTGLEAGTYRLTVDGGQPVLVSLTPSTPLDVPLALLPGDVKVVDFGFCPLGKIRGRVFVQPGGTDCTGTYTPGVDTPAAGVLVSIEFPGGGVQAVPTGPDGTYEFADLGAGTYTVTVDTADPVLVNVSPSGDVVVDGVVLPGETTTIDFPFCEQSLSGRVFREPAGRCDGDLTQADTLLAGVQVSLLKVDDPQMGLLLHATTNAAGFYEFRKIPTGAYEVSVDDGQPILLDLTPSTPEVLTPVVLPAQVVTEQDFGFCPRERKICGTVYREPGGADCDGTLDAGTDVGIPGVEVSLLLQGDDQVLLQTTDAEGRYCFTGLAPGVYQVAVAGLDQPEIVALDPSTPTERVVTLPSDTDVDDVDFGFCPGCEETPCCEGDLHEVVVETEIWVGDWCRTFDFAANFYACCTKPCPAPLDRVALRWYGAFPGPIEGLGEILTVESVTVHDGMARIRIRITAAGPHFRCGYFGRDARMIRVCLNGRWNEGCAPFRCETVRPGSRFTWTKDCGPLPPCPVGAAAGPVSWISCVPTCNARFFVVDTRSYEDWKSCENPPPCTEKPPTCACPTSCDCRPCEGGVTRLTLRYTGTRRVKVRAEDSRGKHLWTGTLSPWSTLSVAGGNADGTIGAELRLFLDGRPCATIPTSCIKAVGPGYVAGPFRVLSGASLRGGILCPVGSSSP